MSMQNEITIVVPVYNESENIERLTNELIKLFKNNDINGLVLFVDDGSTDNSLIIIKQVCTGSDLFRYIALKKNRGLSAALKAGFDQVKTPLTGYIDADMQTDPGDFVLLLKHIPEFDLVTGVRSNRKDGRIKNMSSKIANSIRNAFTNDGMDDTGCPLKVIKTGFAKKIPMFKGLHRFLPAMVLLQNGKIKQIPVKHFPRIAGESKFGLSNRLTGPLIDCFAYLWMKSRYINYQIADKSSDLK